jgi:flagellin
MSLVVNNNLMAANVARNLNQHYGRLQTSTQRLSSGLRINSAADDAAGLAIRELQRADIAALHQGARNANDAISMIQTADGAMGVIDEKLIRMKELAEQAATGTYSSTQRLMIESEYQAMASEITRIANATDFNGMKLLDGTLSGSTHDGTGLTSTGKMKIHFGTANDSAEDYYYITIGSCTASSLGVGNAAGWEMAGENLISVRQKILDDKDNWTGKWNYGTLDLTKCDVKLADYKNADGSMDWAGYQNAVDKWVNDSVKNGTNIDWENVNLKTGEKPAAQGEALRSAGYTVSTQEAAQRALEGINNAIESKDKIRAHLGAMQNRLENTITNLNVQAENLQAAESRISDVDVATEMTQFVRNQILTQSAVAMLGQANSLPQMAMQLIGG